MLALFVVFVYATHTSHATQSIAFLEVFVYATHAAQLVALRALRLAGNRALQYLTELVWPLSDVVSRHRLRSVSTAEVLVPATHRATIGDRAFAVVGPRA